MADEIKVDTPKVETPKVEVGPVRGGLMKRTLRELQMLEIPLKDIGSLSNFTFNLSWVQIIKLVNFNADKKVLNWKHTLEEALEVISIFLV